MFRSFPTLPHPITLKGQFHVLVHRQKISENIQRGTYFLFYGSYNIIWLVGPDSIGSVDLDQEKNLNFLIFRDA
jgi:hypothetical protein